MRELTNINKDRSAGAAIPPIHKVSSHVSLLYIDIWIKQVVLKALLDSGAEEI